MIPVVLMQYKVKATRSVCAVSLPPVAGRSFEIFASRLSIPMIWPIVPPIRSASTAADIWTAFPKSPTPTAADITESARLMLSFKDPEICFFIAHPASVPTITPATSSKITDGICFSYAFFSFPVRMTATRDTTEIPNAYRNMITGPCVEITCAYVGINANVTSPQIVYARL